MQHVSLPLSGTPIAIIKGARYQSDGYSALRAEYPCACIAFWRGAHYIFSDYSEYGAWRIANKRKPRPIVPTPAHANICFPYGQKPKIRVKAVSVPA